MQCDSGGDRPKERRLHEHAATEIGGEDAERDGTRDGERTTATPAPVRRTRTPRDETRPEESQETVSRIDVQWIDEKSFRCTEYRFEIAVDAKFAESAKAVAVQTKVAERIYIFGIVSR